jgi:hypothetical protein
MQNNFIPKLYLCNHFLQHCNIYIYTNCIILFSCEKLRTMWNLTFSWWRVLKSLLGQDAMYSVARHQHFGGTCFLHPWRGRMLMEAAGSSEILAPIHQNKQHHTSEHYNLNQKITISLYLCLFRSSSYGQIITGSKMHLTTYVKVNLEWQSFRCFRRAYNETQSSEHQGQCRSSHASVCCRLLLL